MHDCKDLQGETDELQEYLKYFYFWWLLFWKLIIWQFHQDEDQSNRIASTYQKNKARKGEIKG